MRRVAVIGAGASGLVSIKTCLEDGLEPVCFEKTSHIGGLWHFSDEVRSDPNGPAAIHDRLHTIACKESMAYSDFPFPKNLPPYLKGCHVYNYYVSYADHFGLLKYVKFNTEVLTVEQAADSPQTSQWRIKVRDNSGDVREEVFDAVMVCSGLFSAGHMPEYPGLDKFQGEILHSCQMVRASDFKNKTVLIVGAAFTAGDIACSLSEHAKQVYLSMRNGAAIVPRIVNQRPVDNELNKRYKNIFPARIQARNFENLLESFMDYSKIGIRSHKSTIGVRPMLGNEVGLKIFNGDIAVRSGIVEFEESKVVLVDGSVIDDVDTVIFATGYDVKFPFLNKEIMSDGYSGLKLFRMIFLPRTDRYTMAFLGFNIPNSGTNMTSEMQARYATKIFKKEVRLPSEKDMEADITGRMNALYDQFGDHVPFILDLPSYLDSLASSIGALPSLTKLILTDPKLAYYFLFGTNFPPTYRLVGPGSKPGAREACLRSEENLFHGIHVKTVRKDVLPKLKGQHTGISYIYVGISILCAMLLFLWVL